MNRTRLHIVQVVLVFVVLIPFTRVYGDTVSEIEKQLMCQCGCGMVVASCQCSTADKVRAEIQAKLDKGIPSQKIIQDYVAVYGEKGLSAPTKRGFNLTAWIAPFAAIAGGLAVLYLIAVEFVRRGKRRSVQAGHPEEASRQWREQVDEELKDYL